MQPYRPKRPERKSENPHHINSVEKVSHEKLLSDAIRKFAVLEADPSLLNQMQGTAGRIMIYAKGAARYLDNPERAEWWFKEHYMKEEGGNGDFRHFNFLLQKIKGKEPLTLDEFRAYFFQIAKNHRKTLQNG